MSNRLTTYPINPLFIERWSPRAMSGEAVSEFELMTLFEAARWAPSSYNNQPWRFVYAIKGTEYWDALFPLLVVFNQEWVIRAGALVIFVSKKTFDFNGKASRTHSFDTGAAWMSLALQGHLMGLVVHGMEGFDYDKAPSALLIPSDHTVEAMCAIGRPGEVSVLSQELQKREQKSDRKPLSDIIFEGQFGNIKSCKSCV